MAVRPYIYNPPTDPYLTVLYSDEDILVIDKPSGILSVPGRTPDLADCLHSRAKESFSHATVVHRLDRATSGIMVMALNKKAHVHLSEQFAARETDKTYVARVWGNIKDEAGTVDLPLICDWPNRPKQMVDFKRGKPSITDWKVIEREDNITRVRLYPKTGRSHQLRVHMLSLGHPILGDDFYAEGDAYDAAERLQLHAETLSFKHPVTLEKCSFESPCPF